MAINYWWNLGFLAFVLMLLQILSGVILTLFYSADQNYYGLISLQRDVYWGFIMKLLHNNLPSLIYLALLLHISRSMYYGIYQTNVLTWNNGVLLLLLFSVICYLGYVLSWGQISYWGATVILNLVHPIIVQWISGNYFISITCLRRFFILHFILPFVLLIIFCLHVSYLHDAGSMNPGSRNTTSLFPMTLYVIIKDVFVSIVLISLLVTFWDSLSFSHSDNLIYPNPLVTPTHIVPE